MRRPLSIALLASTLSFGPHAVAAKKPARAAKAGAKTPGKAAAPAPAPGETPAPAAVPAPSAEGNAKRDVAPGQTGGRYLEGMGRTPSEARLLEEVSRALEEYENESRDFRREVQLLVEKKYEEKRNTLAQSYEKAIRDLEILERKERLDAIAQFEEFLQRYPDEPRYTPDVMFRLAELYYERSTDDHVLAMREYEEKVKKLDPDKTPTLPAEPTVDFAPSIALYRKLITDFPGYGLNDGAHYLLGYCLEKQNDFENGQKAYQTLIARYPRSKFATEAWVRIGEYYFDAYSDPKALPKAAEAYEAAIRDRNHPLFDKALYKLGWTYYRMDRFDEAVDRFLALVDYYDAKSREKGEEAPGGDLRGEALQYSAISFADEKWGSLAKAKEKLSALGGRPYEAEVYKRLGDVYFDQTRHADAVEAYRLALMRNPTAKDAPQIQQRIVQAYERDRMLVESFTEASKLGAMFTPGTAWYERWKREPVVVQAAQELAEKSLYSTAVFHHQQALVHKQEGRFEQARATFDVAARAYQEFLTRFPRAKMAYELEFYLAECLYNAFRFKDAAKRYEQVRDSSQDNKFMAEASFSAVLAWQKQLELDVKSQAAPDLKPLRSTERAPDASLATIPFAEAEKALLAASDAFLLRYKTDPRSPGIAYKAAELFYTHNDFPEARRRFEDIIQSYPSSEVAKYATNLIVESYLVTKDWKSVEEVSARLAENKAVIDPKSPLYKDLVKFKLAGRFKRADELMAKGEYDAAAEKYIALVDEEPKHEFADKALNNAAVAYENTRRFDSALKLYERIFRDYPTSKLADAALFRVAVNAENSYDFDKAVASYQKLVREYPAAKDREAALYNSARLLEGQQRYDDAARAFLQYADLFPKSEDAPKNQFRAALIYEKQGEWNREIAALNEFITKFQRQPAQAELVIDAKRRIGDAFHKLGKEGEAQKAYASAADDFDRRNLKPDAAPIAADAAAQSRFQLAEQSFREFDRLKIGGSRKALEKSFTAKRGAVKKVNDAFAAVFKYKRLEWTLAALFRRGYALERFAQTIVETPIPPEIKRLGEEAVVLYQDQLAQQTTVLEDKAVESYVATLSEARKNRISNEWTKRTLEALNRFRPAEYPVLKEPKQSLAAEGRYATGLIATPEGPVREAFVPQKLKGEDK